MDAYFEADKLAENGIPSVEWIAKELGVSHRYMSDTIKVESGKTAIDQINLFLVEEAKNLLLNPTFSISEVAHKLGFEYTQYFSTVFKNKTGMTPKVYIKSQALN